VDTVYVFSTVFLHISPKRMMGFILSPKGQRSSHVTRKSEYPSISTSSPHFILIFAGCCQHHKHCYGYNCIWLYVL